MRLASPPLFMISPASMKKGIAISGKLSAPLMMFCATIWESNIPIVLIRPTTQTSRAKAIGMPSAMAPSSEKVKTAIVMGGVPALPSDLLLLDGHQVVLAGLAGDDAVQVVEQYDPGRDAEDDADEIENGHRQAARRRAVVNVDDGLAPAPGEQQPVGIQHQAIVNDEADTLPGGPELPHQRIDAEMRMLADGDDRAEEGEPNQQPARQFLGRRNAGVEAI